MLVNFVCEVPELIAREAVKHRKFYFTYSRHPIAGATNVFLGPWDEELAFSCAKGSVFVVTEPPEIHRWSISFLRAFSAVISPPFRYLQELPNFHLGQGLLPWRIGVRHEIGDPIPKLSFTEISGLALPQDPILTAVISDKTATRMHRKRLDLVHFLQKRIKNFVVYGRGHELIPDKIDALSTGRFHLAIENSSHQDYFTEKLTDPLLVGNFLFYGGHRSTVKLFSRGGIAFVDPESPRRTLWEIQRHLDTEASDQEVSSRLRNRDLVLKQFNLHVQVANVLSNLSSR